MSGRLQLHIFTESLRPMNLSSPKLSRVPIVDRLIGNRFVKFGIVGFSGTVVNLVVLYTCQEFIFAQIKPPERRLTFSLAVAIILSTLNNFLWNRTWTWRDRKNKIKKDFFFQLGQYFLACWFSILLQFAFVKILAFFSII